MNLLDYLHRGGTVAHYWTPDSGEIYTDQRTGEQKQRRISLWFPVANRPMVPAAWQAKNVFFNIHPQIAVPEKLNKKGNSIPERYIKAWVSHVQAINCFFGEFDVKDYGNKDAILTHLRQLPLYPSVIVDSGGGFHCYWLLRNTVLVDDSNRNTVRDIQAAWVKVIKSDGDAKDLARVLRVPGTKNLKPAYAPDFPTVTIIHEDYTSLYDDQQFDALTVSERETRKTEVVQDRNKDFADEIITAARCVKSLSVSRRDNYSDWLNVGMALKSLGEGGFQLWDEWSRGSQKYNEGDCKTKWRTFTANGLGIGSLIKWAKTDDPSFAIRTYTNGHTSSNTNGAHVNGKHSTDATEETKPSKLLEKRTYPQYLADMRDLAINTYDEALVIDCLYNGEEGDARLLNSVLQGSAVYDHAENFWFWWNQIYWEKDDTWNIHQLASDVLSDIYKYLSMRKHAESIDLEKELLTKSEPTQEDRDRLKKVQATTKAAKTRSVELNDLNKIKRVLGFAVAGVRLGISGSEWDTQINLLACQNTVIDLMTGEPVAPDPKAYIRTVAPIEFDAAARCPRWEKSILEIFDGNQETADYVQRFLGYAISGSCVESDFLIWYGKNGRNGKEFILERIRHVLGEKMAGPVEPELLLASKNARTKNSSTEGLMALRGRRLAWASETNEGRMLDLAAMKDLSGGHILTGRHNHGRQIEWKRTHTLILLTNHKPHINSQSLAEWDRVKLQSFSLSFVNEPDPNDPSQRLKDKNLGPYIDANEAAGVLNWAIEGCLAWRAGGLMEPESVKSDTSQYRQDEDVLGHFIKESCFVGEDAKVKPSELYRHYVAWSDGGGKPMGKKTFYGKMEERGFQRTSVMGYEWFIGVGKRHDDQP